MSKSRFQEFTLVVSYLLQPRLHQPFASRPDFISHGQELVACLALALRAINGGHKIVIVGDS